MSDRIVVMNDGEFEQIGTPEEVYSEPESVFVGDFMGKSNLFAGQVTAREDGLATVETSYGAITATADGVTTGTNAQLLVRPEDLSIAQRQGSDPGGANSLTGEVGLVQLIGSIVEYEVDTEYGPLTVEVQSSGTIEFERGDPVTVSFDPADVRSFTGVDDSLASEADDGVEVAP